MLIILLVLLVVIVFTYKVFSSVEIKVCHKGFKNFMLGIEVKDNSCLYYKEYSITIGMVILFVTITFTK